MKLKEKLSNDELYRLLKTYILREELGYFVNSAKFREIYNLALNKNSRIFESAMKDALFLSFQIKNNMGNVKVVDLKRIDFMNEEQLKILLFTIGAAKNHQNISESESAISSFAEIFGVELENLLFCKVSG